MGVSRRSAARRRRWAGWATNYSGAAASRTWSGAASAEHLAVNRAHVGVIRGGLSREFHEWRPALLADFVRMAGTGRYAPSQSEASVLADLRRLCDELEREHPGLKAEVSRADPGRRPVMGPFEVPRSSPIVAAVGRAYRAVRGAEQPTGPMPPYGFYGTDAAHFLHRLRMQGVVCGPGGRYNTMPDERVDVPDYLDMIRIYILAMLEISGAAGSAPV